MAFSKICDDRGKLGKGQKETGAKGRKREETRREGAGDGIIWLSIFATSGEEEGGRSFGRVCYKEGEKSGEKQLGVEMQNTYGCFSKRPQPDVVNT